MLLLKCLISRVFQKTSLRSLSSLDRFCKKDINANADAGHDQSITIQFDSVFKLYNLEKEPKSTICLTKKSALKLYNDMQSIRRMENACANLYTEKTIRGFCHLYVGQEACAVGIKAAMRSQDTIITSYRSHGWTWLMGVPVHDLLAELCQRQSGCSRGKGGSMHTYAPNFFGGNGIVGAQTPVGTGLAFAHAYRCDGGVTFACYGDGAANQGQLHEVFNMACLWQLPIVYVCENNKYGMGTAIKRSSCNTDYYTRGDYIPGLWVNGNDVLAVRAAAEFAVEHAKSCGPLVMELETYRYHGHSMSDPGTSYRKRDEVQMMRQKYDPITMFKDLCAKNGLMTEEEFKKIDNTIKTEIDAAVAQVRQDKDTELEELAADVYVNNLEGNIRGIYKRDLKHRRVGTPLIPLGTHKATPKSQIKESPKSKSDNGIKKDGEKDVKTISKADSKEDKEVIASKAAAPPREVKVTVQDIKTAPALIKPANPAKDIKLKDPKRK